MHTHTHTHARMHARTHARTHAHTHTHTEAANVKKINRTHQQNLLPAFCFLLKADFFSVYNSKGREQRNSIWHQYEDYFFDFKHKI